MDTETTKLNLKKELQIIGIACVEQVKGSQRELSRYLDLSGSMIKAKKLTLLKSSCFCFLLLLNHAAYSLPLIPPTLEKISISNMAVGLSWGIC